MAPDASPRHRHAPPPVLLNPSRTLPGRVFLVSAVALAALSLVQHFTTVPAPVELLRKGVSLATRLSFLWLVVQLFIRHRADFLWRVRRKLVLSYVFLGLIPVALIALFVLVGGYILHANIAGYLFREGLNAVVADVDAMATASAAEVSQSIGSGDLDPEATRAVLLRAHERWRAEYPGISLAVVPIADAERPSDTLRSDTFQVARAGRWGHMSPPQRAPRWVAARGFSGLLVMAPEEAAVETFSAENLLVRCVVPIRSGAYAVVVDLPVDTDVSSKLDLQTHVRITAVGIGATSQARPETGSVADGTTDPAGEGTGDNPWWTRVFRRTVYATDFADWRTGTLGLVDITLDAPLTHVYQRMSAAAGVDRLDLPTLLALLGSLLLIVQGVALFFGIGLVRQITSAIHQLSEGTERVQRGEFTHRIRTDAHDELGALGQQFNEMSASIEHLLHVQREKQRLDDELRIAHEIQTSLLPERPPLYPGLSIADLCLPAREVGGDYYDFFELGPRQLGVLVADVSGKGTSAALYMAELKGLMLALSHEERSPKTLLSRVNHLLADHLDNRSFITMTYGVIDLDARTLTHARAGHTPLLVVSKRCDDAAEVIIPNGMVLGLRLPGAADRFESLLEEHTMPIESGDVIVFYTDGITEAMNAESALFGDDALAKVVCGHRTLDAAGIRERVLRDVHAFVGGAEQHDDMTMVIVKVEQVGGA